MTDAAVEGLDDVLLEVRRPPPLLKTKDALKQVAGACGFRDADALRRAFVRRVGTTPAEHRRRQAGT